MKHNYKKEKTFKIEVKNFYHLILSFKKNYFGSGGYVKHPVVKVLFLFLEVVSSQIEMRFPFHGPGSTRCTADSG